MAELWLGNTFLQLLDERSGSALSRSPDEEIGYLHPPGLKHYSKRNIFVLFQPRGDKTTEANLGNQERIATKIKILLLF